MRPTVSVAVAVRDGAPWIRAALESALAQRPAPLEIVVLDDGSTDGTLERIGDFRPDVRLIRQEPMGAGAARDRLLHEVRGGWVQCLDADDVLHPGKIAGQLALVESDPDAAVVVAPAAVEGRDLVVHESRHDDDWCDFAVAGLGITSANLWNRRAVLAAGGWATARRCCLEYDVLLRLLQAGGRVIRDRRVRTTWGISNPRSVSRRDPARRAFEFSELAAVAGRHLREHDALDEARQALFARALMDRARILFRAGRPGWREADAALRLLHERPWEVADPAWRVWARVYRHFGLAAAERYDRLAAPLRPAIA